jgi:hypothetical protein
MTAAPTANTGPNAMIWINSPYPTDCRCGSRIERGFKALRVFNSRLLLCHACGKRAMARAAEADEKYKGAYAAARRSGDADS